MQNSEGWGGGTLAGTEKLKNLKYVLMFFFSFFGGVGGGTKKFLGGENAGSQHCLRLLGLNLNYFWWFHIFKD